jgi:hypothetical protein
MLRCGRNGAAVLRETRSRYEREGVKIAELRSCEEEETTGPGCPAASSCDGGLLTGK